jgi:hypothetical protein
LLCISWDASKGGKRGGGGGGVEANSREIEKGSGGNNILEENGIEEGKEEEGKGEEGKEEEGKRGLEVIDE